jgi:uncharacterized pyridoxal phosphate-containing UPF0001 family protein
VDLIHSGDSVRLIEAVDEQAASLGLGPRILLEINCSGEATKQGFEPDEVRRLLPQLADFAHVRVTGVMTMAPLEGGEPAARRAFAALRELRDDLAAESPPNVTLAELSMGMSGDFAAAIAEGATIVRIGAMLFEGVVP